MDYVWWDEDEYKKIMGQYRLQLNEILLPLRKYGQDVYVDGAIEQLMILSEKLGMRLRGKDIPVILPSIMRYEDD